MLKSIFIDIINEESYFRYQTFPTYQGTHPRHSSIKISMVEIKNILIFHVFFII